MTYLPLLLAEETTNLQGVQSHLGNLIFMLLFFLACVFGGIWWLKRNS